jgi:hypothetical protein
MLRPRADEHHPLAGARVDTDDKAITVGADEGVPGTRIRAAYNSEWEAKERAHLTFPVTDKLERAGGVLTVTTSCQKPSSV